MKDEYLWMQRCTCFNLLGFVPFGSTGLLSERAAEKKPQTMF